MRLLITLCLCLLPLSVMAAGLPVEADACLRLYYFNRHTNDPPANAWKLMDNRDGAGIQIAAWNIADPRPTLAQVNALTNAVAAYVEDRKADSTVWTRRERLMLELLYQVNQQTTNAMTRAAFRQQIKTVFQSLPE